MNKEVGMLLPKKEPNTSGVGKINNYCEAGNNLSGIASHSAMRISRVCDVNFVEEQKFAMHIICTYMQSAVLACISRGTY